MVWGGPNQSLELCLENVIDHRMSTKSCRRKAGPRERDSPPKERSERGEEVRKGQWRATDGVLAGTTTDNGSSSSVLSCQGSGVRRARSKKWRTAEVKASLRSPTTMWPASETSTSSACGQSERNCRAPSMLTTSLIRP